MRARIALVLPLVCALAACSQTLPARPADDRAHEAWIEPALGRAADFAVVVRMKKIREDATYNELMDREKIEMDPTLLHLLLDADELSLEATIGPDPRNPARGAQWMMIVRGAPADLAPKTLEIKGHALFEEIGTSTGGVIELASQTKASERLLIYPNHVWVFAPRAVAARLEASATPPPPLHFDDDALVATYVARTLAPFAERASPEAHAVTDAIEFTTAEVDTPAGDSDVVLVARSVYADEPAAQSAEAGVTKLFDLVSAELSKSEVDGWLVALVRAKTSVAHEGKILTVTLRIPRFLVEKGVKSAE